ncbi:hypothetical protein CYLTODRAFT_453764 [Cylindrobasidium torrendii FP15055 ss-10]|uniref:Uncharacterized protein n=1 Tax=Cylindrobasidium torrendii FP15055 ss-10 TaxID=1314674 RepID=A0A0D7BDG2_9AGAR|nr:hypothetical protein CYLTODRAFT_453764 [Cylindrobasidium torrendii FP15055 ss-10]
MGGFFWFLVGAGTATIWGQHKQWHEQHMGSGEAHPYGPWGGYCERRKAAYYAQHGAPPRGEASTPPLVEPAYPSQPYTSPPVQQQSAPAQQPQQPPREAAPYEWPPWGRQQESPLKSWDERDFRKMRTQAEDAMTDMSEATLDTLMATILAAKTKLADRKIQREAEEKRQIDAFTQTQGGGSPRQ